MSNFTNELI